ncbi:cation-translocating P-type ATPase [Psychrobacter sp. H8-1]|uniref:cation-translocating P-type ATPase n=1 Tax=Psychrobacter sp. H8-1 TaxID=2774129 RepID=UPI001917E986|nr:cation-translocating P-type ATPase [Psychrobacter sp. H8-1]
MMWHNKTTQQVEDELGVDPSAGLSPQQVAARLEKYGKNKIEGTKKKSLVAMFFAQMQDALIYVLLAATVITFIIGEYTDSIIILSVVLVNAIIGVVQEYKAEQAIEALQKMANPKTMVRREGANQEIDSEELVPGDVVIIDAGRFIPADLRLIESSNLQIEESALTGESVAANKDASVVIDNEDINIGDRANMAFRSTTATYGRGEGVVIATGMQTEMGKIASILDSADDTETPLQRRLDELGKVLGLMAVGVSVLILVISVFQGRDTFDMFLIAISLAVAAIPEGLAAIVAIVLALGVTRMSKINAIIKKLPAVETLGSVNIICSDKTGTLTQNRMTVVEHFTLMGNKTIPENIIKSEADVELSADEHLMARSFLLCNDASIEGEEETGDPTEIALVAYAQKMGLIKSKAEAQCPRIDEQPFDSERKLMSTLNQMDTAYRVNIKGAMDRVLPLCTHVLDNGKEVAITEAHKVAFIEASTAMGEKALRVLAAAYKNVDEVIDPKEMEKSLVFVGIVGMMDPPREEVKDSIAEAKKAGITAVMITGDHPDTAFAIAKQLDMASERAQAISGSEINQMSEEVFNREVLNYRVFARVSPEHKVRIVKALQSHGNIVSMTGDGVNDAPALKVADIGVAMGITGTDVSKSASDMILADDNFTTIVHAIEEGRNIYKNIKKSVIFLLSCNLGEVITILVAIIFAWPLPLLATQILWINLITDSFPAIALGVDTPDKEVMNDKPRDPTESFFAGGAGFRVMLGGVLIGALALVAFYIGLSEEGYHLGQDNIPESALAHARTMTFLVLAGSQLFYSLALRHESKSIFQLGLFSNPYLIAAVVFGFALQIIIISVPFLADAFKVQPLEMQDWLIVLGLSLIPFVLKEFSKLFIRYEKI